MVSEEWRRSEPIKVKITKIGDIICRRTPLFSFFNNVFSLPFFGAM